MILFMHDLGGTDTEDTTATLVQGLGAVVWASPKVSRAVWNGRSTPEEFAEAVKKIEAEDNSINYIALQKGTVVPPGQIDNGGGDHINTGRIA